MSNNAAPRRPAAWAAGWRVSDAAGVGGCGVATGPCGRICVARSTAKSTHASAAARPGISLRWRSSQCLKAGQRSGSNLQQGRKNAREGWFEVRLHGLTAVLVLNTRSKACPMPFKRHRCPQCSLHLTGASMVGHLAGPHDKHVMIAHRHLTIID